MDHSNYVKDRIGMVEHQLKSRGITSASVLEALSQVPREYFVPPDLIDAAYSDSPLEIGHGQTISQPYIVAYMTEALHIAPRDRVLEIGTGSGYQTAVLAKLADIVFSVERIPALSAKAKERLASLRYSNVRIRIGDGWKGWPEEAPFDKIIVTAAPDRIPAALIKQLAEGGRMILPVGLAGDVQMLVLGEKQHGLFQTTHTIAVRFVPLVREDPEKEG